MFLMCLSTTQSLCLSKNCKNSLCQTMNAFLVDMRHTLIFLISSWKLSIKLFQARKLEIKIIRKNGLIEKLLSRSIPETYLRQKISNPKELWKTLKSMSLPSDDVATSNICLKYKNEIVFNSTKNCPTFKNYFLSPAQTWYLSYLLLLIFLLNLRLHPFMKITQCKKIWIFNF